MAKVVDEKEWNIILLVWGRALFEVGLTHGGIGLHGAVLEYTVGKGRKGREEGS